MFCRCLEKTTYLNRCVCVRVLVKVAWEPSFVMTQIFLTFEFKRKSSSHLHVWLTPDRNLNHWTTMRFLEIADLRSTPIASRLDGFNVLRERHVAYRSCNTLRIACLSYKKASCSHLGNTSPRTWFRWKQYCYDSRFIWIYHCQRPFVGTPETRAGSLA